MKIRRNFFSVVYLLLILSGFLILIGTNCLLTNLDTSQSSKISSFIGENIPDNEGPCLGIKGSTAKNYTMIPDYFYLWDDATSGVRCAMAGQDDANQQFFFPFSFQFYNLSFNSFYVCTNGFVSFVSRTTYTNVPFPSGVYTYMIAPFWDDLRAENPCNIFVQNLTNRIVIEWQNYRTLGGTLVGTFEIILFDSGDIIFNYDFLDYASSYTCGLNFGIDTRFFNPFTRLNTSMNDFSILFRYNPAPLGSILYSFILWQDASIYLSDVTIASSVISGDYLGFSCRITSDLNICRVIALIQNEEIQNIAILDLYDDGKHNDGGVHDGIFGSIWSSSNMPLETYQVNLLVANNNSIGKLFNKVASFSIVPSFLSQYGLLIWIIIGISILLIEVLLLIRYRPREVGAHIKQILPKGKKISLPTTQKPIILQHKSGERPYNTGISLKTCPNCKIDLPTFTKKQLELGYRVYCPTTGCFYPLYAVDSVQEKVPEHAEPPNIREKVPDASKAPKLRDKVPESTEAIKQPQGTVPPKAVMPQKVSDLKYCPHCNQPLTDTQLKLKQSGKKVMCRKCLELI